MKKIVMEKCRLNFNRHLNKQFFLLQPIHILNVVWWLKKIKIKSLWKASIEFLIATNPHLDCNLTTNDQRIFLLKTIHGEKCWSIFSYNWSTPWSQCSNQQLKKKKLKKNSLWKMSILSKLIHTPIIVQRPTIENKLKTNSSWKSDEIDPP
jgi:hypothetical protein